MIEVKKKQDTYIPGEGTLFVNGRQFPSSQVRSHIYDDGGYNIIVTDSNTCKEIISYKIIDFPINLEYLRLNYNDENEFIESIYIERDVLLTSFNSVSEDIHTTHSKKDKRNNSNFNISFRFVSDMTEWKRLYSFSEYYNQFCEAIERINDPLIDIQSYKPLEGFKTGFEVQFPYATPDLPISIEIENRLNLLRVIHDEVIENLSSQLKTNSVAISIEVPDEIREPYSQYLVYFSRFLKDLGVNANSELHNEAGNILFTVTPVDVDEALDKIRTALEIYLCLPNKPVSEFSEISTEIEVQRLAANVQHLKSQLALAKAEKQLNEAVIEAKDATIQALRFTVSQQKQLLSGDISTGIIDITPSALNTQKDKEDLIEGIVSLTTYEGQGFEVSLAELFRRLKKAFNKGGSL